MKEFSRIRFSQQAFSSFLLGAQCPALSLRGAQRRSNLLRDVPPAVRHAGDCFGAARLAMTMEVGAMTVDASAMTVEVGAMTVDAGAMTVDVGAMTVDVGAMTVDVGAATAKVSGMAADVTASRASPGPIPAPWRALRGKPASTARAISGCRSAGPHTR